MDKEKGWPMTEKEMEDLGVPMFQGDPIGMNNMMFKAYDKMDDPKQKFSPFVLLLIVLFAFVVLFVPGCFLLYMIIPAIFDANGNQFDFTALLNIAIPLALGVLLFGSGCEMMYVNIKKLLKR